MKDKKVIFNFLFILVLVLFSTGASIKTAGTSVKTGCNLTVNVIGLKNNKGSIVIKLFNSKECYSTKDAKPYKVISSPIKDRNAAVSFIDLAGGEYAIKLFHDENDNGIHDSNFLGIPKEDYAFSNNARGTMGPPDYEKASFEINNDLIITIDISARN
jgi:uncharacterized protein (DUF2141 family)